MAKQTVTAASGKTTSQSQTTSRSETKKVLDEAMLNSILAGLTGQMTDEQIEAFAKNLLEPALRSGIEAAQQEYETTKLSKEQEIGNLATELERAITAQEGSYRKSMADVETAALARGMGRSSYTLETMANQGSALARAVEQLTRESEGKSAQIQQQITQAAQHSAQTQGRLNADYAKNLAAKVQEIKEAQRREYNDSYMTAVSAAMGSRTTGTSETTGTSRNSSTTVTTSGSGGSRSAGGTANAKKEEKKSTAGGTGAGGGRKSFAQKAMA